MPVSKPTQVTMPPLHPDYDQHLERQEQQHKLTIFRSIINHITPYLKPRIEFLTAAPTDEQK